MKWCIGVFGLMLALLNAAPTHADNRNTTPETPTVAICAVGDPASEAIVALLEAGLTQRLPAVRLLDRAQIKAVMAEQRLSAAALTSQDAILRLGHLMACDAIVEVGVAIAKDTGNRLLSLRAFDVATGIRIGDDVLAFESVEAGAEQALTSACAAFQRWQTLDSTTDIHGISLIGWRNVGLSPAHADLPDQLGTLLEMQLLHTDRVMVLDRKRMDRLLEEAAIAGSRYGRLAGATTCVYVDLAPVFGGANGMLQATATLTRPNGEPIGSVRAEGKAERLLELATHLAGAILKTLAPDQIMIHKMDLKLEAERIRAEIKSIDRDVTRGAGVDGARFMAARALALAYLAEDPHDMERQRFTWRFTSSDARTLQHKGLGSEALDAFRRGIEMCSGMPLNHSPFDAGTFSQAQNMLWFLPEGAASGDRRALSLEVRDWVLDTARAQGCDVPPDWPSFITNWVRNADEWLDEMALCPQLPPALASPAGGCSYARHLVYCDGNGAWMIPFPLHEMTPAQRMRLILLLERWSRGEVRFASHFLYAETSETMRRAISLILAARICNDFPAESPDTTERCQTYMDQAFAIIRAAPGEIHTATLVGLLSGVSFNPSGTPPRRSFDDARIEQYLLHAARILEDAGWAAPSIFVFLGKHLATNKSDEQQWLDTAWLHCRRDRNLKFNGNPGIGYWQDFFPDAYAKDFGCPPSGIEDDRHAQVDPWDTANLTFAIRGSFRRQVIDNQRCAQKSL